MKQMAWTWVNITNGASQRTQLDTKLGLNTTRPTNFQDERLKTDRMEAVYNDYDKDYDSEVERTLQTWIGEAWSSIGARVS